MTPPVILAADLKSASIVTWAVGHIVPVLILIVGLSVLSQFRSARMSKVMAQVGIMLGGLAIIAGGVVWYSFADTISKTLVG